MAQLLYFAVQIDCESTQRSLQNPILGARSLRGLSELFAETGTKATFMALPRDLEAHAAVYREIESAGHEVGVHIHHETPGESEFLGDKSAEAQRAILRDAVARFGLVMGRSPRSFCPGYFSANDCTLSLLEELGFTHGAVSCPTRNIPAFAAIWGDSSQDPRYPHRYNRVLSGDVDFVDLPITIDPDASMPERGKPLDLRVEGSHEISHGHMMAKAVRRQCATATPLRQLHALTHNTIDYSDVGEPRRQIFRAMVRAARQIAEREGLTFQPSTLGEIATAFRQAAPRDLSVN